MIAAHRHRIGGHACTNMSKPAPRVSAVCRATSFAEFVQNLVPRKPDPIKEARTELLQLLVSGQTGSRTSDLVDILSSTSLPFKENKLGGGRWIVLYTKGMPQLWKATYEAGKTFSPGNRAGQDLNPKGRTVVNRAEYFGNKIVVTASGAYEPLGDSSRTPCEVISRISSGNINIFGKDIALPIKGEGKFEVLYLDDDLRIFKAGPSYAVQVKESKLDDMLQRMET
eukprot:gene25109-10750_t